MVTIGHASIDENGNARAGSAGDQTGKEVCTRSWYNKKWLCCIRAKDRTIADKIAKAMEQACANPNIGYDQNQRTTCYDRAAEVGFNLSKISAPCETDCSALVSVCVNAAGVKVSPHIWTGNEEAALLATGAFESFQDPKYLTADEYLARGDILISSGHTVVVLTNGAKYATTPAASATNTTATNTTEKEARYTMKLRTLQKGCKGEDVKAIQILLIGRGYSCGSYGADGDFGVATEKAVRDFQKNKGIGVDGIVGQVTWSKLLGAV